MYQKLLSLGIATGILIPNIVLAEQKILQTGTTSATAIGNNNRIYNTVRQSANQSQNSSPYFDGEKQSILQHGESHGKGVGNNNLLTNKIYQNSIQIQENNYSDRPSQNSVQNATTVGETEGNNNRISNTTRQYNRQNRWSY